MICILMFSKCSEFLIKGLYRKYESIINIISTSKATSTYICVENIQRENTHAHILLNL